MPRAFRGNAYGTCDSPHPPVSRPMRRARRNSVSSEPVPTTPRMNYRPPDYPKTEAARLQIREALRSKQISILFQHLAPSEVELVISAFQVKSVSEGSELIKQGDEGDYFYIVSSGQFEITVEEDSVQNLVQKAGPGNMFGELALMYNAPRAATCKATTSSSVWALDRETFRMMCVTLEVKKKKSFEMFLRNHPLFHDCEPSEICCALDMVSHHIYGDGDRIMKQGEPGHTFMIVEQGECICYMRNPAEPTSPEVEVTRYQSGGYFGELALLNGNPRAASIEARGKVCVYAFDLPIFQRFLAAAMPGLRERASQYKSYEGFVATLGA